MPLVTTDKMLVAAALSAALMILTSIFIWLYRKATRSAELEGLV